MTIFCNSNLAFVSISLLLALGSSTPKSLVSWLSVNPVLAQSTAPESFELPPSVPRGTTVRLDGSTSMIKVNQALKERFEKQYPGTTVELNAQGSDAALQALLDGEIDLAAIGRPLTEEEEAQGLVQVFLSRQKIAIITAPDNPFQGDVTFKQFSQIFRGEINDWSQLGGTPGAIQLIDRPDYSDTRRAFQRYDVFKAAPFETGSNATQIDQDSTEDVIKQLGANGIGYAIADQVIDMDQTEVKIIPMHKVLPDDPRYPFSQELSYVYKEPPTPPVEAFAGYATDPSNEEVVDEAIAQTTTEPDVEDAPDSTLATEPESENAALSPVASENAETATADGKIPWWWLLILGIPLLGALLWLLLKDRDKERKAYTASSTEPFPTAPAAQPLLAAGAGTAVEAAAVTPPPANSRVFLVPYDGKNAYAYWDVAPAQIQALQRQGGEELMVRLYDVTDIRDPERYRSQNVQQFGCDDQQNYVLLTLPSENRDYLVELGYLTQARDWLPLARSGKVRVASSIPTSNALLVGGRTHEEAARLTPYPGTTMAMTAPSTGYTGGYYSPAPSYSRLFLVPYDGKSAYAYWEIAPTQAQALQRLGGEKLILRLYDVTDIPDPEHYSPYSLQQFGCRNQQNYVLLTLPSENRDYMVELGYLTQTGNWLPLTRSETVRVAASLPISPVVTVDRSINNGESTWLTGTTATTTATPSWYMGEHYSPTPSISRVFLVPYDGKNAYAYWEIAPTQIQALQRQGGEKLILRLYDVTDSTDPESNSPSSVEEYDCELQKHYVVLTLPSENRDYMVELGYLTSAGDWLPLTRSETVQVATHIPTGSGVLFLVHRDNNNAYTYWEVPPTAVEALKSHAEKS